MRKPGTFSLRSLLWLCVVCAGLFAAYFATEPARRSERAASALRAKGVELQSGGTSLLNNPLVNLFIPSRITHVTATNRSLTDADLVWLEDLPHIRRLRLYECSISDKGMVHLSALSRLEVLSLNGTSVSDDGLKSIRGLDRLVTVQLARTKITNGGLSYLPTESLMSVDVRYCPGVTRDGVRQLRALSRHDLEVFHHQIPRPAISSTSGLSSAGGLSFGGSATANSDAVRSSAEVPDR